MANDMDWQIGIKRVGQRAGKILESAQWSDVIFNVGHDSRTQIIRAHRLILAMASPVFEAMFYGSMAHKEEEAIEISDVQPNAFKALLKYIYTDEIVFTAFEQVCEICYAAKKYMIPPLVEECLKFIWKDLHPGNVCRAYAFVLLFEESLLLEQCLSLIQTRTEDVVMDGSFEEAELPTLKTIVSQDTLNISETVLWEGIVRWGKQECFRQNLDCNSKNQRKMISELIPHIRFLTLSPTQFANGPALTNILSQEECFGLLMNISSPGVASLPPSFSSTTSNRKPPRPPMVSRRPSRQPSCTPEFEILEAGAVNPQLLYIDVAGPLRDTFINNELVDCTLSFSIDKDICIVGIVLPTQLKPADARHLEYAFARRATQTNTISLNKYPELIYAFLQDANGCRLTYTHFSARVCWESNMEVLFNKPIYILPDVNYKIVVVLNKMGKYPLYTPAARKFVGDMNFTFFEDQQQRESIVKTLIFKNTPVPSRESPINEEEMVIF